MVTPAQLKEVFVGIVLIIGLSIMQWFLGVQITREQQGAPIPVADPVRSYPVAVSSPSDYSAR